MTATDPIVSAAVDRQIAEIREVLARPREFTPAPDLNDGQELAQRLAEHRAEERQYDRTH